MHIDERIVQRLRALIDKAEAVRQTWKPSPPGGIGSGHVDATLAYEWRTQSLTLLIAVFGESHTYTKKFEEATERLRVGAEAPRQGVGVLRAALEDVEQGYLFKLEGLVAAEVFEDFLDMAAHLLEQGYKDPAASLIGAVLEDGLRRAATEAGVAFSKSDGLDSLNTKLAREGSYNKLVQSKIDTWRVIRNAADHGNFGEYQADDVAAMREGVQELLGRLLS